MTRRTKNRRINRHFCLQEATGQGALVGFASACACCAACFVILDPVKLAKVLLPEIDAGGRLMAYKLSLMSDVTVNAEASLPGELT